MDKPKDISQPPAQSYAEQLERELYLKQLQMNSLLAITQAINNNVEEENLYRMYASFVTWDLEIPNLALIIHKEGGWQQVIAKGQAKGKDLDDEALNALAQYTSPHRLKGKSHPFPAYFHFLIPIWHKDLPLAAVLIGAPDEIAYDKIQIITAVTGFVAVGLENKRLFRATVEQQILKKELALASEIQQMLLPKQLPHNDLYALAKFYRQHSQVGGDYYDYFPLDENRFAFCIADVAGKGIGAAMLMANFQANLRSLIFQNLPADDLITKLNKATFQVTKGERFITLFFAIVDFSSQEIRYVNAGHLPPLYVTTDRAIPLRDGCMLLGATPTLPSVQIGRQALTRPSMILAFTDGLTDLRNAANEYLSQDRLAAFAQENFDRPPEDFIQRLYDFALQHKQGEHFPDDITMLVCKLYAEATTS